MTKIEQLKQTYNLLSAKYSGKLFYVITNFFELFTVSLAKLRSKTGAMHCTNINRILTADLLNSGLFTKNDIKTKWTLIWYFSPHQYLQVKTEEGWIDVDIWAQSQGIAFGDHAHGFHLKTN